MYVNLCFHARMTRPHAWIFRQMTDVHLYACNYVSHNSGMQLAQRVMHVAYSGYVKESASTRSANLRSRLSAHLEK